MDYRNDNIKTWRDLMGFLQTLPDHILDQSTAFGTIDDDVENTYHIRQMRCFMEEDNLEDLIEDGEGCSLPPDIIGLLKVGQMVATPYEPWESGGSR